MNAEPRHPLLPPEGMSEDEWDALADAEADADIAAGRLVPHEKVAEWARRLGTSEETPMPREWLE
jgi:predicted transcriptional regulator